MRTFAAWVTSLLLLAPVGAPADDAAPPAPAPPPPDLTVKPPPDLEFKLLDEQLGERPVDKRLEAAVRRRRIFLQSHQAAGLTTWALMGATVVYGRLDYADTYLGGATLKYRPIHKRLAYSTTSAFTFTGLAALLAPEPYPKKLRLDTALVHKASMALATVGMATQIVLGRGIYRGGVGGLQGRELANAHQAVGIGTFAAMTVGAIALAF